MRSAAGLLGLLLLLLPGGAAAQPSPPPAATPLAAPQDVAFVLPARVGSYELEVREVPFEPGPDDGFWGDLLLSLGKEPSDVRQAVGIGRPAPDSVDGPDTEADAQLWMMRIEGVPADAYVELLAERTVELASPELRQMLQREWRVMDERDVYAVTLTSGALGMVGDQMSERLGMYFYPAGEVLFFLRIPQDYPADAPSVDEFLAALP
jgi:hypothetical protein